MLIKTCVLVLSLGMAASAALLPIGYISYDVTAPGSTAQFDITNNTGVNSSPFPDTTWPVTTTVSLSSLSLTVDFSDGTTQVFGSSYFTLGPDGISFNGGVIPIGGSNPQPTDATLTGTFSSTTVTLNDGSSDSILSSFSATILPSSPPDLSDGDLAIINATTTTAVVPEPGSWLLLGTVGLSLLLSRRLQVRGMFRKLWLAMRAGAVPLALLAVCLLLLSPAQAQVSLNVGTSPSTGVAGVNFVNVTGSVYPSGHGTFPTANQTITFSLVCGGQVAASTNPTSISHIIGSSYRSHVLLPASLTTNTYFVALSGTTSDGTSYSSTNCSQVAVTHTSATLSACVPTSSLGVVAPVTGPAPVKALVPNGAWIVGSTGIQVVQLETGGGPAVLPISVPTPDAVNSCAGNPATGEGVCVSNSPSVYHLSPSSVATPLTSGANAFTSFSGGSCENCGVAINALTNQAVIAMGQVGSPSGTALQTLDLATDTFHPVQNLFQHVSEDISIDPTRGYLLSPNEYSNYAIEQINSSTGGFIGEFDNLFSGAGEFDSAAEDCTTGIALTVSEFTNNVLLADLTQATFVPGAPGSWTGPSSITTIIGSYSAGLSGVTVAPGTSHLATVTGEFGGSSFSVLVLPATSGTGTPAIVDYAYIPCITGLSAGYDPHTMTAYISPNDGKAYTVFASTAPPSTLVVADMAAVLALPRQPDGHTAIPPAGSCLANGDGIARFVSTH